MFHHIFHEELNEAFAEDGKLRWKLLAGAVVGLGVGLKAAISASRQQLISGVGGWALIIGAIMAACLVIVFALSLKDVVKRRIRQGQPVSLLFRWYLASGFLSLGLWVVTAILTTFLVVNIWS